MRERSHVPGLATLLATVLAAACGTGEPPVQTADAEAAEEQVTLSPDVIEELKQRYPTLREEPAPEPQPSAAARSGEIPRSVRETVPQRVLQVVRGEATFYANHFEGRRTASGIPFRQNQLVAAHRAFPFGTLLRVTNTANDRSVNVRVVDRGPFGSGARAQRTVIDLSRRAAQQLGFVQAGRAQVRVEVLEWGDGLPRV
jgi:rare lipoprotein A